MAAATAEKTIELEVKQPIKKPQSIKKYNQQQVLQMMLEYHEFLSVITALEKTRNEFSSVGIAQYGDDAGQPKPQGMTSDPIYNEYIRRNTPSPHEVEVRGKAKFIQFFIDTPAFEEELNWKDKMIFQCTLDGVYQTDIAQAFEDMGVPMSYQAVQKRQKKIAKIIAEWGTK